MSVPGHSPTSLLGHPLRWLARHWGWVAAGVACLVGSNLLAQAIPWMVKRTIEAIEQSSTSWQVGRLALSIAGLAVAQALFRIPSRVFIFNAARQAEYRLRGVLFARLCQADSGFYRGYRTGDLMSRLTNDISSVRALFGPGVLHVVNTVFAYAIALPLMLSIDPWLTLWALVPYPVLLLGARSFALGIYSRSRDIQLALATMSASVQEDLAGIREVKLHAVEPLRAERFRDASATYLHQAMRLASWRAALIPFVGIGAGASLVIVLWVGGSRVIAGQLSLGDLVALNLYVGMLAWPTMSIGWILSLWQRGIASWHRLLEIAGHDSPLGVDLEPRADELPAASAAPSIELREMNVAIDGQPVLHDVSLTLAAGTVCGVVGRVGCGKTTLIEALARLIEVEPNTLFIDGQDVTRLPVDRVRRRIAYAPQNAFLFSASVADNVAFGLDPAVDLAPEERARRIARAVSLAGLGPDLESFPRGLETLVGERGISLSGGQRQRIALARALIADRPILLLDDSLSSVDADTERQILEGLSGELEDRTVVLVSHRLSALQHADQVAVLEQGRLSELGTHAELLAREGSLYSQLYRRQLLLQQLEEDPR